jgi:putative two-component system response regulator
MNGPGRPVKKEKNMAENERKTILVVDDDVTILTTLRKILEQTYDICLAKSADAAWHILNNTEIDLILLDIEMPGMTGIAFMEYLKENNAFYYNYIPVIFVTSHATQDIILKAKMTGAKDFAVKPVDPGILQEKIKLLITAEDKNSDRNVLLKEIHQLDLACRAGRSDLVEKIAERLKAIRYNAGTDTQIAEFCRCALLFDYSLAVEKINLLLKNNLFDRKA